MEVDEELGLWEAWGHMCVGCRGRGRGSSPALTPEVGLTSSILKHLNWSPPGSSSVQEGKRATITIVIAV